MKKSILKQALAIARRNIKEHPEFDNFLHFTFIVQDGKIIEWGTNNRRSVPIHYGYGARYKSVTYSPKTHSEVEAYRKARGLINKLKPFYAINIRLNRKGSLRRSKPCWCCYLLLASLGCRRFFYTADDSFEILKIV